MKKFLIYVVVVGFAIHWTNDFVSSGKLVAHLDKDPHRRGTATILYVLASTYEVFQSNQKALELYARVAERYPKSRYGEDSAYGEAACYERLKRIPEAIVKYETFAEKYPESKYKQTVNNNIYILKNR